MIKLSKTTKPDILIENELKWTSNLLDKLTAKQKLTDTEKSHYRHADVKQALVQETHGKCAYCESKLLHISYGDVEHITPKSSKPEKTFEWENLTLACDVCNTNKGTKEDIVDPYDADPSTHFFVYGSFILPRPGDDDALFSERSLGLNRADLLERREKRIQELHNLVCLAGLVQDPKAKAAVREDILIREVTSSVEFAAISRKYLEDMVREKLL